MKSQTLAWLIPLSFLTVGGSASAQDAAPPAPHPETASPVAPAAPPPSAQAKADAPETDRDFYASFSPIHLLFPILEVTGELRINRKMGAALILGYGQISATSGAQTYHFKAWEIGGQFVGYAIGHFDHGMQLGLEVLQVGISTNDAQSTGISGTGAGLAVGPLVGYKYATPVGFTFNIQAGAQYMAVKANASDSTGASASASDRAVIALFNANVGWSF